VSKKIITLIFGSTLLTSALPLQSHEVVDINGKPVTTHTHVWRQQSYGTDYRQGHSVDNALGNITIYSPNTYKGYSAGSSVRFARPVPYSKPAKAEDPNKAQQQISRTSGRKNP